MKHFTLDPILENIFNKYFNNLLRLRYWLYAPINWAPMPRSHFIVIIDRKQIDSITLLTSVIENNKDGINAILKWRHVIHVELVLSLLLKIPYCVYSVDYGIMQILIVWLGSQRKILIC